MSRADFVRLVFPDVDPRAERLVSDALAAAEEGEPNGAPPPWREIDRVAASNEARVLRAFHDVGASEGFLAASTGYGYDDLGRQACERAYAILFGGREALVRPQLASGTHALTSALFGVLRPGDELVVATGLPYDTLWPVLGIEGAEAPGSLAEWGVRSRVVPLGPGGRVDLEGLREAITPRTRLVLVQRSRGYADRLALSVEEIGEICSVVHRFRDVRVLVDNAYGEFVEEQEPGHAGADLVAGSLIKNPGGGLAPTGGYLVGDAEAISLAAARLTAPGIASEVGPNLGVLRWVWMGLFLAPHVVGEALAGAVVAAHAFGAAGFGVSPGPFDRRFDIVQAVRAGSPRVALAIVRGIQQASALDARAVPRPARLPGYRDPVAMAGGTFVQGSSIELSADLPMRPPYDVFLQGGLSRHHVAIGVARALHEAFAAGAGSLAKDRLNP